MQLYYYLFVVIALLIILLFVRSIFHMKKNMPVRLFVQALKNENSGHLREAVVTYKCALDEVRKIRFHNHLESKIIQKLKVLNTVIEYTNNSNFTR